MRRCCHPVKGKQPHADDTGIASQLEFRLFASDRSFAVTYGNGGVAPEAGLVNAPMR